MQVGINSIKMSQCHNSVALITVICLMTVCNFGAGKMDYSCCYFGWVPYNCSCYYIADNLDRLSFGTGKERCHELNSESQLVSFETAEELDFIREYIRTHIRCLVNSDSGWLTSGKILNGVWKWEHNGVAVEESVIDWFIYPTNKINACMLLYAGSFLKMKETPCDEDVIRSFICEI